MRCCCVNTVAKNRDLDDTFDIPCPNEARESGLCYYDEKVEKGLCDPSGVMDGAGVLMKKRRADTGKTFFKRTAQEVVAERYRVEEW